METDARTVRLVPVEAVRPGNNDRKDFDPDALAELAASIQAHGLAQPITIRPVADSFEIVAGERRFRAVSQVLGWETIPAIVRELDDETAAAIMLAENTGRADLNPVEEANAYATRMERFGWSEAKVAELAGVSVDRVQRRLSLLRLVPEALDLVKHGQFPLGHAEAAVVLDNDRQRVAIRIFSQSKNGMPLAAFRAVVSDLWQAQSQDALFDLETYWMEQADEIADMPRSGKKAVTGAPIRTDLPELTVSSKDTPGMILDRYIAALLAAGHDAEAGALGIVYNALVRGNYTSVPVNSQLRSR